MPMLDQYRGKNRVLLLFAPMRETGAFARIDDELSTTQQEAEDRDMKIFRILADGKSTVDGEELPEEEAAELRERFDAPPGRFLLVLIGKDGEVKRREEQHIPAREIYDQIDQMPMRRREMGEG